MNATTVEVLGFAREPGWLPWAVQYFFLIGISCTAFLLSLPGLVWRRSAWRGVSRRALLVALVCGLAAPVALLADLHQPGRFLNFYLHPNLGSWMAWGAFFIPLYLFGLLLYSWLSLRPRFAELAHGTTLTGVYRALAYGGHDNALAIAAAAVIAAIGAVLVLLYTGMEVMVVAARPFWNTAFLPVTFAATAAAGALGMTAVFEALAGKRGSAPLLKRWIARSQVLVLAVLAAWLAAALTGVSAPAAAALAAVRSASGWLPTVAWLFLGSVLALWLALAQRSPLVPALLALQSAWLTRWVVFMDGQELPKLGATFYDYAITLTPDSLLGIVGTAGFCLVLYIALTGFVPWDEPTEA